MNVSVKTLEILEFDRVRAQIAARTASAPGRELIEALAPTFRLRQNVPGSSYAFEIARRLGMPEDIVEEAARIAGSDVGRVESLIAELDGTLERYREERERAEADRLKADRLKADYEARLKEVERRERELEQSARQDAQRILSDANALIERTVRELREQGADRASIRRAHEQVRRARESLAEALAEPEPDRPPLELKPGDRAWVRSFEKEGLVVETRSGTGRALVEVGKVRLEVPLADLEARKPAEGAPEASARTGFRASPDISPEVDLRGMTAEEAVEAVDRYLDELYLGRLDRATIIHGKGTGALRKAVGDFLKGHPYVKSHRLGNPNEGGAGATVVTLDLDR